MAGFEPEYCSVVSNHSASFALTIAPLSKFWCTISMYGAYLKNLNHFANTNQDAIFPLIYRDVLQHCSLPHLSLPSRHAHHRPKSAPCPTHSVLKKLRSSPEVVFCQSRNLNLLFLIFFVSKKAVLTFSSSAVFIFVCFLMKKIEGKTKQVRAD